MQLTTIACIKTKGSTCPSAVVDAAVVVVVVVVLSVEVVVPLSISHTPSLSCNRMNTQILEAETLS